MELERTRVPVVATDHAPSAGLLDENRLQLLPVANHSVGATPLAAVVAAALERELGLSVVRASQGDRQKSRLLRGAPSLRTSATATVLRAKPVLPQPVTDRSFTPLHLLRDLRDRQTCLDQLLQAHALEPSLRGVLLPPHGLEP